MILFYYFRAVKKTRFMDMKKTRARAFCLALLLGVASTAGAQDKNAPARAVAGKYDGTTNIELLQMTLPLQLELQRVHDDSVIVKIPHLALPNGQVFSFTSDNLSVTPEKRDGKRVYRLSIAFNYNYNNMPLRVEATGIVAGKEVEAEVKAVIMNSMETRVTYKGKRLP
jgi:hypothetical protein